MSATIRDIVNDAQGIVGEVAGAGVQVFSEDRQKADAIRAFNMMFKKYHWHQYRRWYEVELDGVQGITTTEPFAQVLDFEDFIGVYRGNESKPLPVLPIDWSPFTFTPSSSAKALFWTSLPATSQYYPKRKLQFFPQTATGVLHILAMEYPRDPTVQQNWDWTDVMYLDRDMLAYATAYMTLSGDDLNAGSASVIRNLLEMKFSDVTKALSKHQIPISGQSDVPSSWMEYPY